MPPKKKAPIAMPSSLANLPSTSKQHAAANATSSQKGKSPAAGKKKISPAEAVSAGDYVDELEEAEKRRDETINIYKDFGDGMAQYNIDRESGRAESFSIGLGIACVTEAISQKGAFKFALYDVFQFEIYLQCIVGEKEKKNYAMDRFDIRRTRSPIYLCYTTFEELETTDAGPAAHDGHHILATAHLEPDSNGKLVKKIRYYDSAPHWLKDKRREVFKKTQVALKQWGGSVSKWECEWVPVVHQGEEACGIHVILNAWTLALGLEAFDDPENIYPDEFYDDAARLISCAVHGAVSSDLIMAFFRCWNFLADPDSEPLPGREFNHTYGVHDIRRFGEETMQAPRMSSSPLTPTAAMPGLGGPSTAAAQFLGPDQLSTSGGSSNQTVYVDSQGSLSDLDSQEEGNPDKNHDHDEENNPDPGDNSNEEQGSNEQEDSDVAEAEHSLAFWPEGAEKYPSQFMSARLRRADRILDRLEDEGKAPDNVHEPCIKLSNQGMWCACIASVTEAISLNGYQQEAYLNSDMGNDGIEDRDYACRDFYEEGLTKEQQEDADEFMAVIKKKQKEHRTKKRVFSFYGLHCLERADQRPKERAPEFGVLRRMEPIMIPISHRHLVYVTPPSEEEEIPRITHYWVESLESPGLPSRRERFLHNDDVRALLERMCWGPEPKPEPGAAAESDQENGDSKKKKKKNKKKSPPRNDIWNLVSPVDPNLLIPPEMRQQKEVVHLILTAWTIALGFRPPSTLVINKIHDTHYFEIEDVILRAVQGLADSATIFAGLRSVGWIPKGVVAPPESVRFDTTVPFWWYPNGMNDYYDYKRREIAKKEDQDRVNGLRDRWDETLEKLGNACREYEERYSESYVEENVSRRLARKLSKKQREELHELMRTITAAQANEKNAREEYNEERGPQEMRNAILTSLDDKCHGRTISNDAKTPARMLHLEGEEPDYGDTWLLEAELSDARRSFLKGKCRYEIAIKNLPITMGKAQDRGLRELQSTTGFTVATRPFLQALIRTLPPAAEDGGTASAAEDPRGLKRSYEEFADERLVVDVGCAEYDELLEIHNSGRGLHTVGAHRLARLFTNRPARPGGNNVKRRMVDAAELHFNLLRKRRR